MKYWERPLLSRVPVYGFSLLDMGECRKLAGLTCCQWRPRWQAIWIPHLHLDFPPSPLSHLKDLISSKHWFLRRGGGSVWTGKTTFLLATKVLWSDGKGQAHTHLSCEGQKEETGGFTNPNLFLAVSTNPPENSGVKQKYSPTTAYTPGSSTECQEVLSHTRFPCVVESNKAVYTQKHSVASCIFPFLNSDNFIIQNFMKSDCFHHSAVIHKHPVETVLVRTPPTALVESKSHLLAQTSSGY